MKRAKTSFLFEASLGLRLSWKRANTPISPSKSAETYLFQLQAS